MSPIQPRGKFPEWKHREADKEWREWLDGLYAAGWRLLSRNDKAVPLSWLDDHIPPPDRKGEIVG